MGRPQVNWGISLGNIISTAAMLTAMGVAFGTLKSQNAQTQVDLAKLEHRLSEERRERKADVGLLEGRARIVENIQARNDERFVSVLDALERIDGRLNQVLTQIDRSAQ